ncbi:SMI1/KNR4 family protein [Exiguobacterium sp. RIT452]|uniref:SMI1/KNR4 family protein n=1 Tax=Exiguobacterium sp. RIT452 TaxID=2315552 RepID=UPI000E70A851|nr:SMI1/KNR4 family protein [Exiguobacterium sp. RIT452]RJP02346.1 SMI1/KNR4 family protein [Exiguobacterium sp. RIT452]
MNQIAAVLGGLQQKINHGSTFIQRKYNEIGQAKFNFPEPVTASSLAAFEAEFNQKLPSEYQTFLELHDGADLFILDDGLGLVLYSLDKVIESTIEAKEDGLIDEDFDYFWVIGEVNEGYLLIHTEHAKTEDTPYMYWKYHEGTTEDADPIGQNFGTFLEYSIIAQGDVFWEFKDFSIEKDNYFVDEDSPKEDVKPLLPIKFVDSVRVEIEYPISKTDSDYEYTVSIYEGKSGKERLMSRHEGGSRFNKLIEDVRNRLSDRQFHYSLINVFQTESRFWENEEETGDSLIINESPQKQGLSYDGYRAFADQLPRPLPGWE